MIKILLIQEINDLLKSRWIIAYTLLFFIMIESLYWFSGDVSKVLVSLTNVILIVIPLISLLFGIQHIYYRREFNEILLSQPIPRRIIFVSSYLATSIVLSSALILGSGLPILFREIDGELFISSTILLTGVFITCSFLALAYYIAFSQNDKAKGFGIGLILWALFVIVYDGLFMLILYSFRDYPLEVPAIIFNSFNPINLARIIITLKLDLSAMMGYTGAIYKKYFGSTLGIAISSAILILWIAIPYYLARRSFIKKDF